MHIRWTVSVTLLWATFLKDDHLLENRHLLSWNADATIGKPEIVLIQASSHLSNKQDRVGSARVTELDQRALWPGSPLEAELTLENVKAFERHLHQRVGPAEAAK